MKMEFTPRLSKRSKQLTKSASGLLLTPVDVSKTSCESSLTRLFQTDLSKFCPKKLFYIVFVTETDQNSALLLDRFIEISRNYEEVSSVSFITREDVLCLLDTTKNYIFPNQLKPILLDVIESLREFNTDQIPSIYEAQMLKLKLIQVMYQQYVNRVNQNQKEKKLEDLLNYLSRECKRKQKKDETGKDIGSPDKNKSPTRDDAKKKNKKDDKGVKDELDEIDYTSIPLDDDGISFEEDIFNCIWFYCIKGFYNNEVFQNFTEQLNSPLCAIIKIMDQEKNNIDIPDHIETFWKNIDLQFFQNTTSYNSLEDTILMHFTTSKSCTKENSLEAFQEFVSVLRRIIDIKLSHLKYLRYLTTNKIQNFYPVMPLDCMQTYYRSLKYFPLECINSTLILDALLKEVCYHLDLHPLTKTPSSRSLTLSRSSVKSYNSIQCTDPLYDFQAFANIKKKTSVSKLTHDINSFLTHENNTLLTILKSYRNVGPRIFDISVRLLKQIPILKNVPRKVENNHDDILHTHDVDPSNKFEIKEEEDERVENFMYLFLFKTFSHSLDSPNPVKEYNLIKNLMIFDVFDFWNEAKLKWSSENIIENEVNLYDTLMVHFRWKEKLTSDVMIQTIFDATNNFLYFDQKFSPETDNFLVVFSDKLDKFGLNTKIFDEVVRTPVCLRDFCRYTTVKEAEWLQKHEVKILDENTFKVDLHEVCPGAQKVRTQMKFFREYSYLLDSNIKEEVEDNKIRESLIEEEPTLKERTLSEVNFEEVFTDLQKYPSHKTLLQECENASESQQLLSYNLGTNLFKVTGHITTFRSHDGVKVTVDNTRFLQMPEKCTVNVICNGNTLTLHSSENLKTEPYILSLLLKDDTRIGFIVRRPEVTPSSLKQSTDLEEISEENEEEITNIEYETPEEQNITEKPVKSSISTEQVVHCVDEDFLKKLLGENQNIEYLPASEDSEELLEAILTARDNNGIVYKVNTKSKYLKRLNPDLKVPVEHAFRNVLPTKNIIYNTRKAFETHTKRFESLSDDKSDLEIKKSVDFRLCLPNGLFIKAHPCVIDKNNLMIKQEYAEEKPKFATVQHEEFRLFSNLGFIFIKKIDGTVTILKANGDIIDFEKPSDGSGENNSFKPCHCSTLDDYRNKLNKMMKDEVNSDYVTSRRGHITHKQNYILDKKLLKLLENLDVPYLKKSITRFDGKKIKIQGNKISQKQLYHMTSQQDFFTGEIFCERNDNFKSTFEGNGSQKILFPDGTLISNSVKIADELVDGFVYVTLSFQYEHPNYATVIYDFDMTLKINLNNDVVIEKHMDTECFTIKIEKNILVSVSKEKALFQKTCEDCLGSFQCNFNIEPFYANTWTPKEQFFHVQDTYDKHFYSDFIGNCSRNEYYMKGRVNKLKCDHYRMARNYKKLFVINKDFSGEMFCSNDMIQNKIKTMTAAPDTSVSYDTMLSNTHQKIVDCRKMKYTSYCDRFFNNSVLKYFHQNFQRKELYATFRIFHTMFKSVKEIEPFILQLQQVYFSEFFEHFDKEIIFKNIALLKSDLEVYNKTYEKALHEEQEIIERKKRDEEEQESKRKIFFCPCAQQRISMTDKMNNWRKTMAKCKKKIKEKKLPSYFNSEFCNILE